MPILKKSNKAPGLQIKIFISSTHEQVLFCAYQNHWNSTGTVTFSQFISNFNNANQVLAIKLPKCKKEYYQGRRWGWRHEPGDWCVHHLDLRPLHRHPLRLLGSWRHGWQLPWPLPQWANGDHLEHYKNKPHDFLQGVAAWLLLEAVPHRRSPLHPWGHGFAHPGSCFVFKTDLQHQSVYFYHYPTPPIPKVLIATFNVFSKIGQS